MQGKIYDCSDEQQRVEGIALAARAAKSGQLKQIDAEPQSVGVRTLVAKS